MTFEDFMKTTADPKPPPGISQYLLALWLDHAGNWEKAHETIQDIEDADGAWVHAYLHRKEGDAANAGYWYDRAGKPRSGDSLSKEWVSLVRALLVRR